MAIDPITQVLYSGSHEGVVCARALAGTSVAVRLKGQDKNQMSGAAHAGKVAGMAVVNGGLVSVGWDDKLRLATVSEGAGAYHTAVDVNGQPCSLATHASTDLYAVVTTAEVALYRGTDKTAAISMGQLGFQPTCAALWGEEELAVGGSDFKTHIYALQGGNFTPVKTIDTRSAVSALAYHPSGETLAIGDEGRQAELYTRGRWEVKVKGKWVYHTFKITCLAWSPEGRYLASGSLDENVYVWHAENVNAKVQIAFTHTGGVSGLGWAG